MLGRSRKRGRGSEGACERGSLAGYAVLKDLHGHERSH